MEITEIEDIENIEQSLVVYGELVTFPVRIEDVILDASTVMKRIYIGNKQISHIIAGGGNWNVIQGENKVPFSSYMDAVVYILKEEGYL